MKRYQIFISSTYSDLKEERQAVLESILKLRHIPVGMEQFVAANEEQFNYIKRLIDETDYYVIIIGNRYGSTADDGISYTEKEFDYAVSKGIPILAFIHRNPDSLPANKSEISASGKKQLKQFREKVKNNRLVSLVSWDSPATLSREIVVALTNVINDWPRPGWERVQNYDNSELISQINDLRLENIKLKSELEDIAKASGNTVNSIFEAFASAFHFQADNPPIVIHYFYYSKIDNDEFLIKDRRYSVEEIIRTVDYSLEKCRLNANGIIMCKAFTKNRVVFENLEPNHTEQYDTDIKEKIDSDIRWVLACPVWKGDDIQQKIGVVVVFGTSSIAEETDANKIKELESLCIKLSKSISYPILKDSNFFREREQ